MNGREPKMNSFPQWADELLSEELPALRGTGEGPQIEFKADFPEQSHGLAEVAAAFATSGGGRIVIGVTDDGALCGLNDPDASTRDKAAQRAQGLLVLFGQTCKRVTDWYEQGQNSSLHRHSKPKGTGLLLRRTPVRSRRPNVPASNARGG